MNVWIGGIPDFESGTLLNDLAALLGIESKWVVKVVGRSVALPFLDVREGVVIYTQGPKFEPPAFTSNFNLTAEAKRVAEASSVLADRLRIELGTNFFSVNVAPMLGGPASPTNRASSPSDQREEPVPEDTMLITVGVKPLSALLNEQATLRKQPFNMLAPTLPAPIAK